MPEQGGTTKRSLGRKARSVLHLTIMFFPDQVIPVILPLPQVIEGRVAPETYEAKLEAAGVPSEKPDVKQFLDNMTYDR